MAINRIMYLVLLITMTSFICIFENTVTYTATYAVLLFPILSLILSFFTKTKFSVIENLSTNIAVKGENIKYILNITNNSFIAQPHVKAVFTENLFVEPNLQVQTFYLEPKQSKELIFDINAKYRGSALFGVSYIWTYDILGLFRFKREFVPSNKLIVLPRIINIPNIEIKGEGIDYIESNTDFREDYSEISHLRDYIPTDNIRQIHWKMSAKRNSLVSKNYQKVTTKSATFIIDNSANSSKNTIKTEDKMIEACVSIMFSCTDKGHGIRLRYIGDNSIKFQTSSDFELLYTVVSNITFDNSMNPEDFSNEFLREEAGNSIFIFTRNINILEHIQEVCSRRNYVTILYFVSEEDEYASSYASKKYELSDNLELVFYTIYDDSDLFEILTY